MAPLPGGFCRDLRDLPRIHSARGRAVAGRGVSRRHRQYAVAGQSGVIGAEIRRRIRAATALTASVGIAPNKLLAKIASDLNKPDGLCRIGPENMHEVLDALPIQKLFGVGQRSLPAVEAAGIRTFGDLQRASEETLWRAFGKHGKAMQARGLGIDDRPVVPDREGKSISAEHTFADRYPRRCATRSATVGTRRSHCRAPARPPARRRLG